MAMMGSGAASGEERARRATEDAIASPLLEDVSLSGVKGILANITAGMDLSIGEFDEVGNILRDIASDDATVVVGTVIDPAMTDGELRVTVVATGLGQIRRGAERPEMKLVAQAGGDGAPVAGALDEKMLDTPTIIRQRREAREQGRLDPADPHYLDIPAFLRRQAD